MAEANIQGRIGKRAGRKLTPRSDVWKHFTRVRDEHGNETKIARCNCCSSELNASYGTSSLKKHIERCIEEEADVGASQSQSPPVQTSASTEAGASSSGDHRGPAPLISEVEASKHLARMIAFGGYDASVMEDDNFRSLLRHLNPDFKLPSRGVVEDMCDTIFDEAQEDFFSKLRGTEAGVSFSAGTAETIKDNTDQVMYIAWHFIDDQWNLHRMVTDACVFVSYLYGPLLGVPEYRRRYLEGYDKSALLDMMLDFNTSFKHDRDENYFPLFPMVNVSIENADEEDPPSLSITKFCCTTCMDNVFHSIARCLSPGFDDLPHGVRSQVKSLDLTRQKREKLLSDHGLEHPQAYDKAWYALYYLLEIQDHTSSAMTDLDSDLVSASRFRQIMLSIWRAIYRAIQSISASRGPTSNLYLVELFKIRHVLDSELAAKTDFKYEAKRILDKAIQDSYLFWSIPLVLDPRYKLKYVEYTFRKEFDDTEAANYISKVTRHIEELYGQNYSGRGREGMGNPSWNDSHEAETELSRYLKDSLAPEIEGFDILKWWKEYGTNQYPTVARMARDALAIPTCSKLSPEQTAQAGIVRGYSKKYFKFRHVS